MERHGSESYVMSAGSARPLEDAFRIAQTDLIAWISEEFGLDTLDTYQLMTQASESPVANVVDPNYTFVCKIRKKYLPEGAVYRGIHRQARDVGQRYLAERGLPRHALE
jgi:acetamidase/formamidase